MIAEKSPACRSILKVSIGKHLRSRTIGVFDDGNVVDQHITAI